MVGLISGDPRNSLSEKAAGSDLVAVSGADVAGAQAGSAFAESFLVRIPRQAWQRTEFPADARQAVDYSDPIVAEADAANPPPAVYDVAAAKEKWPGVKFDSAVSEKMGQSLYDLHYAQLLRDDTVQRGQSSIMASMPANIVISLGIGLLDPFQIAAGLVPVLGVARGAALVARAGARASGAGAFSAGAGGRALARAGIGAVEGAVGTAVLEPVNYALKQAELNDWTMGDALTNIAMGAAFGSILHVGGGMIVDTVTGRRERRYTRLADVMERNDALAPEVREGAFRGAVAAVAEERPVNVAPLVDLAEAHGATVPVAEPHVADIGPRSDTPVPVAQSRPKMILAELDAREAADIEYRSAFSSGSRNRLKKGETWRGRLAEWVAREDADAAAPVVEPAAAAPPIPPATTIETAQTGKPFSAELMRGEGRSDSPYSEGAPQEAVLGAGRWTTSDREYAGHFGENITQHSVQLDNPIVIRTDAEWRALTKEAGWKYPNPFGQDAATASADIARLRALLEKRGYDGAIIDPVHYMRNDDAKVLWNVFGAQQAVEFRPKDTASPVISAAAQREKATRAAQQLADNAATSYVDPSDVAGARENAALMERAPKVDGPIEAEIAELTKLNDEARAMVDRELKAGRLSESDVTELKAADERAALMDGNAKAAEEAGACLVTKL